MATTTMLFGPEWMRPKNPARSQNPPSPPPNTNTATNTPSSYSALVATMQNSAQDNPDQSNPFLYSKEEMLRIYKEGGGRGGLGLEVERWEGVVREVGNEPAALKEWTEAERKLFSGALNSEMRRRQSSDYLSPLTTSSERPKLNGSSVASPMRERFNLIARRRDSSDQATTTAPRKLSLNAGQGPFGPTRDTGMPSPRTRGPLTPGGIDGVLSSGDTWMSRRRASEAGKAAALRGEGDSSDGGGSKIKEEDEEEGSASNNWRAGARDRNGADGDESKKSAGGGGEIAEQAVTSGTSNMASLKLQGDGVGDANAGAGQSDARNDTASSAGTVSTPARPPGLPADLAAIEWSYLDPQGQVQGPFRADVMQSWSQQGYFQPDLPVKRTSIDHEFTPLGLLVQRLGTEKVFLTPFDSVTSTPPGLTQNPDMPPDNTGSRDPALAYSVPYQPIPTRTSQISALENYYGSNSPAPHSPASSFGVARFSNGTPDPGPFAARLPGQMVDSTVGQRAGFAQDPYGGRRQALGEQTYSDPQFDPAYGRIPYNTFGPARTSSTDSYNFGAQPLGYSSNQMPWGPAMGQNGLTSIRTNTLDPFNPLAQDQSYVASSPLRGPPTSQAQDAFSQRDVSRAIPAPASGPSPSSFDANQQYTPSPSLGYTAAPGTAPPINRVASNSSFIGSSQASWPAATDIQSAPKRTGTLPFEQPTFPTSRNTIPLVDRDTMPPHGWASSTQAQSQTQPKTPSAVEGGSPWYNASVGIVDDGWRQVEGLNSLTVSNLGQHNQQQAQEEALAAATATAVAVAGTQSTHEAMVAPEPAQEEAVEPPAEPASQAPAKPKRKVSVTPTPVATSAPVPAPVEALVAESPPTPAPATTSPPAEPAPSKAVWSTDDDKKRGTSMSLREIQEVEARKAAERKAAERAARPTYTPTEEAASAQPFIASWGLPTSQAGAGIRVVAAGVPAPALAPAKEANSTPSTSVPAAPWANGKGSASGVKKTMKEIQEEEERRKAREAKEIASASVRRGYADTTTKVTPTVASGGAWTTVGSNGKTAAAVVAPASRPATTTTTPTTAATVTTQIARKPAAVSTPAAKPIVKSVSTPAKVDDAPIAPSPDFMKWLSESLRSLDSSVSYDDIVSMLLSFPLEVDASTQELISDLIYANSATLDGRRFAVDFVARRKTDAAGRKGVKGGPSIADVVKAQPKPTPGSEWGAFKVVNKKKKGGKA